MPLANVISSLENASTKIKSVVSMLLLFTPPPSPPPPSGSFTVNSRPRILNAGFQSLLGGGGKLANAQGAIIWNAVITQAQAAGYSEDRMVCAAGIYQAAVQNGNVLPQAGAGFTYGMTQAQYGAQALSDFLTFITKTYATSVSLCTFSACAYDWLWPLFNGTGNQSTLLTAMQSIINTRDNSTNGLWNWIGYNNKGGDGMAPALAVYGDSATDYTADFWTNNWNSTLALTSGTPFWNYHNVIAEQADCGNNEGFGYYWNNVASNFYTRGIWKQGVTGTGQSYLDIGWFTNYPLWFLFQHEPGFPRTSGISANFIWELSTAQYETGFTNDRDAYSMLRAQTSETNGALARWCLDQLGSYTYGLASTGRELIAGLLIGDPRVAGQSPTSLSTPLKFRKTSMGAVYLRETWASNSSRVMFFGNNNFNMRCAPMGGITIYKNCPLLLDRGGLWDHGYQPGDFSNTVIFYSGSNMAITGKNAVPDNTPGVSWTNGFTDNGDGTYTAVLTQQYAAVPNANGKNPNLISSVTRKVDPTANAGNLSSIVVTDTVSCDASLNPHICWNMPTLPTVVGNQISFTGADGSTTCTLTLGHSPVSIVVIGGWSVGAALTGTATFTHNSQSVTGVGTAFTSQLTAGTSWVQAPDGNFYQVKIITNDTAMTLAAPFEGTTGTGGHVATAHFYDSFAGSPTNEVNPLDGLNSVFPTMAQADQKHAGGWYRVHVVLAAGGDTMVTTIAC